MKRTAVIMAGGKGERFWPKSRNDLPKQFLSLTGEGKTMIQLTVDRLLPMINIEDIYIVTNQAYVNIVEDQLPGLPKGNILAEPLAKNTAPAIGLAAVIIEKKYGDAMMIVLPSDHLIKQPIIFRDTLKNAMTVANVKENLVTIGITPKYPETGYGYIQFGDSDMDQQFSNVYAVERFVEKPDIEMAQQYVDAGNFLWNSGMFVWKASSILSNLSKFLPDIYQGLVRIAQSYGTSEYLATEKAEFSKFDSVSVDYGIMEVASDIYTISGSFGWDDVGSWLSLERMMRLDENGNAIQGNIISMHSKNMIVIGSKKLIATIGLEDLIVVDTEDVLLICAKNEAQSVKLVIEKLKALNKTQYL
jgi:mannose-1-phosphate guanylyltransferase